MAAHILTALDELIADRFTLSQVHGALMFSSWTEDLTTTDWTAFNRLVDSADSAGIVEHAKSIRPLYASIWNLLNQPTTREQWLDRRLSGNYRWFDLRTANGTHYYWKTRNPASALLAIADIFKVIPTEFKPRRNKRWIAVP